jgi:ketosteroid isomerase-like protein
VSNASGIRADSDQAQRSAISVQAKALVCTKCGATKVAKSHPKNLDGLFMRFVPKRPYRCLHCYHRFWKWEGLFENRQRMVLWAVTVVILAVTLLVQFSANRSLQKTEVTYEANLPSDSSHSIESELDEAPVSQISSINPAIKNKRYAVPTKPLTAEQLERKTAQARIESENAKSVNQARKARLQKTILAESAELESLLKVDIGYRIENWRKAWQAGAVEEYLAFYSQDFVPENEVSLKSWEGMRRRRVDPSRNVSLELSKFAVEFDDKHAKVAVTFTQSYIADSYRETSRKQLVLLKQQQEWKIVSETEINQ